MAITGWVNIDLQPVFHRLSERIEFRCGFRGICGYAKTDSLFDCLPSTVTGTYQVDSTLGSGNYIDVQVDVNVAGLYTITSDTVNGYSFSGTGTFGNTGLNTVRLYGTGRPVLEGINTFIITYGQSFAILMWK